jgi:hypothetical protein
VVDEAIEFLQKQSPLQPFILSHGMSLAAEDLMKMNGPQGIVGIFLSL